ILERWALIEKLRQGRPAGDLISRAKAYIAKEPPAIQGQDGSGRCFHVASILVKGFALSEADAFEAIQEWNRTCQPPWSDAELRHKIRDAAAKPGPVGHLANARPSARVACQSTANSIGSDPPVELAIAAGQQPARQKTGSTKRLAPPAWKPFPVTTLPELARGYVDAASRAIGCDASFVALPLLTAFAAGIGNSRVIRLKRGWTEPAVLWTAIVGESGTLKSPALDGLLKSIRKRQDEAMRRHLLAVEDYKEAKAHFHPKMAQRKSAGATTWEHERTELVTPLCERSFVSDATVEALAARLAHATRGLLLCREELAGWFGSFGQYKAGKGGDSAHFLTMHGARSLLVDRKSGDMTTIHVPRAALSI